MMDDKLTARLDGWASLKSQIGALRKARRALVCEDPAVETTVGPEWADMKPIIVKVECRLADWPCTYVPFHGDHDRIDVCASDFDGPPCSPEEAIDDVDEWCPACTQWLRLLIDERKLRKRVGGLTSALLRQWKAEHEQE